METNVTVHQCLNILLLWGISVLGWVACTSAKSICALSIPSQVFSEWLIKLGEKIIENDPELKRICKRMEAENAQDLQNKKEE